MYDHNNLQGRFSVWSCGWILLQLILCPRWACSKRNLLSGCRFCWWWGCWWGCCTRPDAKTALKVVVIVHVTFERSLLTPQKLAFFYHMNIADWFSPKKGGVCVFRSENTTPRVTNAPRTLDKQAKQTTDTTLHHNFAIWTRTNAHTMHVSQSILHTHTAVCSIEPSGPTVIALDMLKWSAPAEIAN